MFRPSIALLISLFPVFAGTLTGAPGETPEFSVRFGEETITLSGHVDSEESARSLANAALGARPDLEVARDGLLIEATAPPPALSDLGSLITELGLSTQEGWLEIWPDRVLVGGLTDSPVAVTALRLRLEPIRGERQFLSQIRIVDTEDLPKLDVVSMNRESPGKPPVDLSPAREQPFAVPGLLLEKLFPTLAMLSQFDRIEGKEPVSPTPLRALPLEMTRMGDSSQPPEKKEEVQTSSPLAGMTTGLPGSTETADTPETPPMPRYEVLPSVFFSRNSFLLQANQEPVIAELARHLLAPDRLGRTVRIEAVKTSGGSSAFLEYLCEKRAAEVVRFLSERGVAAATLETGMVQSSSAIDEGQVTIKVEIPLPPAAETAPTEEDREREDP
ncbi:MAG: hypothetical protein GXX91_12045 [Verrucomicrobiaceae bacterium]|nr:hypothetical protein [Verrucomicrobiaceae bacterium]